MLWSPAILAIVRAAATLFLAGFLTSQATSTFERAGFLAALMAYHRLLFMLDAAMMGAAHRGVRAELWFHRLDVLVRAVATPVTGASFQQERAADFPLPLAGLPLPSPKDLSDLTDQLNKIQRAGATRQVVNAVIEVVLIAWLLYVMLA
jgi:hypothetical protein